MNKRFSILILAVLFLFFFSDTVLAEEKHEHSTILTVERTDEIITIDGYADEASWENAKELVVTVQDGSIGKIDVELHALYDKDYIYIHASWPDPTESVDKKLWTFNGSGWEKSGDEDRLAIFWNIDDSIRGFNIGGCAMLCHGDRMHTNAHDETGDLWHWQASRTNPLGYADDEWIDNTVVEKYSREAKEAALHGDGTYLIYSEGQCHSRNINSDGTGPRYYEPSPEDEWDAKLVHWDEVENEDAVEIKDLTEFSAGDSVPGYVLKRLNDSRGDIDAKGVWKDGVWSLELKRKLSTGHDDDVQFDIAKTYRFGVAVMDNTGGFEAWGIGHSFDLGVRTLEFGGIGSEEVTQLALTKDYLLAAEAYLHENNPGLAISTITDARALYTTIRQEVADADPALHIEITNRFESARRNPTLELLDELAQNLDDAGLTLQGKREPTKPTLGLMILSVWGDIQIYVFILFGILVLYPLYKTAQTARTPELRHFGLFLFIIILPVFFEGLGRLGILLHIPLLQNFSFTTNEYATLLWAIGMSIALLIARFGFNDVDYTIKSLRDYADVLSESEERHRSLVESSTDAIISIDESGTITLWNKAAEKILGYSRNEVIGKPVGLIVPEKYRKSHKKGVERFLRTGVPKVIGKPVELEAKRKDGKLIPVELALSAVKLEGKYIFTGIIRDITERKKAEHALRKSEEQFKAIYDQAAVGIARVGLKGNFLLANQKLCKILGYSQEELREKTFQEITAKEDLKRSEEFRKKLLAGDIEGFNTEKQYVRKDGKIIDVYLWVKLVKDDNGNPDYFISIFEDITTHKKAEEALKESEKRYRGLFDSSLDGVYQTDADDVFVKVNQAMAKTFGHKSPEEMIGKSAISYWADPKDREAFITELKRKKSLSAFPIRGKKYDGEPRYYENTCRVLEDPKGNFIGIEGIFRDVTERKKAEQALKKYSEELERSNRLKDIFTDIMRHDLLNPAGVVMGMADMALEGEEDPDKKKPLQLVLSTSERMIDMIKSASTFAKLESGEKLEFNENDLGALLRNAAMEMAPLADEKNVKIKITSEGEFPALVNPLIHDVFSNLISNAIKYGPEDSEVVAGIEDEGTNWKISVADNGPGIPDEDKKAVFDRFKRLEKGAIKGTGLGLAIVKRVAEAHKGRVWVEDNPDGGSIFYVTLPLERDGPKKIRKG